MQEERKDTTDQMLGRDYGSGLQASVGAVHHGLKVSDFNLFVFLNFLFVFLNFLKVLKNSIYRQI